jgi:hypothetical protein
MLSLNPFTAAKVQKIEERRMKNKELFAAGHSDSKFFTFHFSLFT